MTWHPIKARPLIEDDPCPPLDFFLEQLANRQPWRKDALCAGNPTDWFYPERGGTRTHSITLCLHCPVNTECLQDNVDEIWGIWGATTSKDRRRIRARIETSAPIPDIKHGTVRGYKDHFRHGSVPPCPECVEAFNRSAKKPERAA